MVLLYKPVNTKEDMVGCVAVIRKSFATVAGDFKLTRENAPTNPAFIEIQHLEKMRKKGIVMFGVFVERMQIGFVAIQKGANGFFMERLAVLPAYRHRGYGRQIVAYVVQYVIAQGGLSVSIGVIGVHEVLKAWYRNLGFVEVETKHFEHLPFPVCYMIKEIKGYLCKSDT